MNRIVPKPDRKPFAYSFLPPRITIALLPVISSEAEPRNLRPIRFLP